VEREEIGDAWALASLIVARAGAGTVSEACALSKPAVFVPLEPSSGDEQMKNAQRSANVGGAIIVRQADCSGVSLLAAIRSVLQSPERLATMAAANGSLAMPDASKELALMLLALGAKQ
jgi:UDP-N-acetylglucosamine--N-acetylmuramyl-(pentapeptide) pyrophosphoryl-undecaprenol N-acetylglucosamine transferase